MRASTKVHIRKRQSSVLSPGQITELALDILNFLTKWKSESISVIVLSVTARWSMQAQRVYINLFFLSIFVQSARSFLGYVIYNLWFKIKDVRL